MDFFWELRQQRAITEAQTRAAAAHERATEAQLQLHHAVQCANKALLVCEALWTLARERLGVTDEELAKRVHDLDLTDGRLDGVCRRSVIHCPACARETTQRYPKCIYCGADIPASPFAG